MAASAKQSSNNSSHLLPLENGDRLTRNEFELRYAGMANIKKAELIEGVVYLASPLRFQRYAQPHGNLIGWLWTYKIATPGVDLGDNPTVRLDFDNEPQPDCVLLINPNFAGQARISDDDYIEGAPELVAEIAASSAANDLHDKKNAYRRNGVQEYIVWQVLEEKLDWFSLQDGEYVILLPDINHVIKSYIFPGLYLEVNALLTGDMAKVSTTLQQGLNSEEHKFFVQQLSSFLM